MKEKPVKPTSNIFSLGIYKLRMDGCVINTKKPLLSGFEVGLLGLEPRQTESKSVVLPLHHNPVTWFIRECKNSTSHKVFQIIF